MIYLVNGISPQMMEFETTRITHNLQMTRISGWEAENMLRSNPYVSVYGHRDSARMLARYWHIPIEVRRERITIRQEDVLILVSVQRSRLREIGYDREHKPIFRFFLVKMRDEKMRNEE